MDKDSLKQKFDHFDHEVILGMQKYFMPMARLAIFIVFFWFGILKVVDLSPANPLVEALFKETIGFMDFANFIILFGIYEMLIGICFLIKGGERLAIALLIPHLLMTFMPLILITETTWTAPFVPTLEGQYIIKNLLIVAAAMGIASHLHPMNHDRK